jgi:hypothetical protein
VFQVLPHALHWAHDILKVWWIWRLCPFSTCGVPMCMNQICYKSLQTCKFERLLVLWFRKHLERQRERIIRGSRPKNWDLFGVDLRLVENTWKIHWEWFSLIIFVLEWIGKNRENRYCFWRAIVRISLVFPFVESHIQGNRCGNGELMELISLISCKHWWYSYRTRITALSFKRRSFEPN